MKENPETHRRRSCRRMDLPWEIIISILSLLPVKSLMRFRCVCKSWDSLFTNPNFIDMHLNRTLVNNKGHLLLKHGAWKNMSLHCDETFVEHTKLEFPFNKPFECFWVEGYSNGLLCVSCSRITSSMRDIYLWNPSIQKLKALPPRSASAYIMYLTFSFVPQLNDYMVVKFLYGKDRPDDVARAGFSLKVPPKVEIYSLRLNSWKEIQDVVPCEICHGSIDTTVNGIVHWVAHEKDEENFIDEFILSFDMANEVFGEIELPDFCYDDEVVDKSVMALKGSLSLFVFFEEGEVERMDIWVMKEYGAAESWAKHFTFDRRLNFSYPFGFMKNGEVVLKGDHGELFSYDPSAQQVKDLRICEVPKSLDVCTLYMESLVLLNEGN